MSVENRVFAFQLMAPAGGVLLLYCVLAALGSIQHAWGWQSGEQVRVQVAKSCSYLSDSGTLSDCRGTWTTERQIEDLAGFGKDIVEYVSRHLSPKVLETLRQGETYLFPRWGSASYTEFTPDGVGGADGLIPWSELTGADVQNGQIVIRGQGGQTLVRSWSDTANAGMLVVMLRSFITNRTA